MEDQEVASSYPDSMFACLPPSSTGNKENTNSAAEKNRKREKGNIPSLVYV